MAIQLSKKQSDLEKRLKILHQQVYGKTTSYVTAGSTQVNSKFEQSSDSIYLQKDLLKILTLSSAAIALQVILYLLLQHRVLNLNFF